MLQPRFTQLVAALFAVPVLLSACTCGPGPNVGGYDDPSGKDPPRSLQGVKFIESEKGDPEVIGCADGQREGFADLTRHKRIAGCLASWEGTKSLRDKPTGRTCGDDVGVCTAPADVCAKNWHVCGYQGKHEDLKRHTTANACNKEAGPGKFIAAMSHGQTEDLCPPPPTAETVFPCMDSGICSEPVCCGDACQFGKCRDGVWRGQTQISLGKAEGCGSVTSERNGGILCCYDGDGDPAAAVAAGDAKPDPAATGTGGADTAPTAVPTAPVAVPGTTPTPTGTPGGPTGVAAPTAAPTPTPAADATRSGPDISATGSPSSAAPAKKAGSK